MTSRLSRPSTIYAPGGGGASGSGSGSAGLSSGQPQRDGIAARIAAKQGEYESLLQLRSQSDALLSGIRQLEAKLATLDGGTAQVAKVLANWANVFRAINVTTIGLARKRAEAADAAATEEDDDAAERGGEAEKDKPEEEMPETLVRIPIDP